MEVDQEEYDEQEIEELRNMYPLYEDMNLQSLDDELLVLGEDLKASETNEEVSDVSREMRYVL
jgi:hypothetical protein